MLLSRSKNPLCVSSSQVSPPRGRDKRHHWRAPIPSLSVQPLGSADWAWLVKRLYKLCMDLCNSYIQMHRDLESTLEDMALLRAGAGGDHSFFIPFFQSETSTPTSAGGLSARGTPSEEGGYRCQTADVSTASPGDTPTPSPGYRSALQELHSSPNKTLQSSLHYSYKPQDRYGCKHDWCVEANCTAIRL